MGKQILSARLFGLFLGRLRRYASHFSLIFVRITKNMEFTLQQKQALSAIESFLKGEQSVFILKGYAGTGKTTLIRPVLDIAHKFGKTCQLMAPTGRAAKILSAKTCRETTTIHKAIYELSHIETVEGDESNESKVEYHFPLRQMNDARRPGSVISPDASVLIIDESSMIGSRKTTGDMFVFGSGILLDDVLRYSCLDEGGKIIFVGDPAQLPPVGDPDSFALDALYLKSKGLNVESFELTEVIRQQSDSAILSNSIKLRTLIQSDIRTELVLDRKEGEVEDIMVDDIPKRFCDICPTPSLNGPVVICYSNRMAAAYNHNIRQVYFPENDGTIQIGDQLIIVGNNYSIENRNIFNGEFASVMDFSPTIEKQTGLVYVDEGKEKKKCIKLELSFRDVTLLFNDGVALKSKIFDTLLDSSQPNITYYEQCALMSNFSIRHKGLRANSPEFVHALMADPYYNAIRAKYGYAITCHKAQGGEWSTTFVDFSGRIGLNKDCLRWSYTAITRARKTMFGHSLHNIPKFATKVMDVVSTTNVPAEYYPEGLSVPAGPFHSENDLASLKAKYWQVAGALEGSGYHISDIDHKPYREIYSISDTDGNVYKYHALYNRAGILRPFSSAAPEEEPGILSSLINGGEVPTIPFSYIPSNANLRDLFSKVQSVCDTNGITIINVVENLNNYRVAYYLQTDAYYAYLDVCVNKHGQITYISPRSELGRNDTKLLILVDALKQ